MAAVWRGTAHVRPIEPQAAPALDPSKPLGQAREPDRRNPAAGDVVSFWDGGDSIVQARAGVGQRGLERPPDQSGAGIYSTETACSMSHPKVRHYSSARSFSPGFRAEFETLTTSPENGGALKAFEARVREGIAARNPTLFEYDGGGRVYRVGVD